MSVVFEQPTDNKKVLPRPVSQLSKTLTFFRTRPLYQKRPQWVK